MAFIPNYTLYRDTGDTRTFVAADHSAQRPHTASVGRSEPATGKNVSNSVLRMRLRIQRGLLDADGVPRSAKNSINLDVNTAVASTTAELTAMDTDLAALATWLGVKANRDALLAGYLPTV